MCEYIIVFVNIKKRENSNSVRQHHNELLSLKHQKQKWKIPYALFIITYIFLFFKVIKQFCLNFPNFNDWILKNSILGVSQVRFKVMHFLFLCIFMGSNPIHPGLLSVLIFRKTTWRIRMHKRKEWWKWRCII